MRLFAQTLAGDVRKLFRGLPANSIDNIYVFYQHFLNRWVSQNYGETNG